MTGPFDTPRSHMPDGPASTSGEGADDRLLEHAIREVRAFVDSRPAPDLGTGVMRLIEECAPIQPSGGVWWLVGWLWSVHRVSFHVRPAYGLLAAALVVALAASAPAVWRSPASDGAADAEGTPALFVQFRLDAPEAANVQLAGSFTNWQRQYDLYEVGPGIWTITLPLPPGVHDYAFIVDGQRWMADPYAPAVHDGFGGTNSRIALVVPTGPRS